MRNQPTTSYAKARKLIRDGDNAMFRNGGLIARVSDGPYTHAAKCLWLRDILGQKTELLIAESREGYGGRIVTLSSQVRLYPGRIDIFRPTCKTEVAAWSAHLVARQAGHDYGWGSIRLAFFKRLMLWRLLTGAHFHTEGTELSPWNEPKHCAQAVCWGERSAAKRLQPGWEPTHKHDRDTEPNDLAGGTHKLVYHGLIHSCEH
jgi:hypothetical protein